MGLLLWLWICFAGGIGLLADGDTATGLAAVGAGVVTLVYAGTPDVGKRWAIRAVLVALWLTGGLLLWNWKVEDWALALRIAFGVLGGTALIAALIYLLTGLGRRPSPPGTPRSR